MVQEEEGGLEVGRGSFSASLYAVRGGEICGKENMIKSVSAAAREKETG